MEARPPHVADLNDVDHVDEAARGRAPSRARACGRWAVGRVPTVAGVAIGSGPHGPVRRRFQQRYPNSLLRVFASGHTLDNMLIIRNREQ